MFLFSGCFWNAIELENDAQDFLIKSTLNPHQFCNNQSWNHDSWPSMSPKKRPNKYQVASSFCMCSLTNCCAIASSRPHSLNTNKICREMGSWCLFGQNNPMINTFLRRGNVVFFFENRIKKEEIRRCRAWLLWACFNKECPGLGSKKT